jgi:protein-S-isoprenylcysteine O-methyltransferase Ste14
MVVRHLLAIAILPFTVTVIIPAWLGRLDRLALQRPTGATQIAIFSLGVVLLGVGLVLFIAAVSRFIVDGKGTVAPWDPPRKFVVTGPYRFVRNPMISGVVFILFAEAALLRSQSLLAWALVFLAGNFVSIPLVEEPGLRARFGEPYDEYCRNVGRLIPRLTPWVPRDG